MRKKREERKRTREETPEERANRKLVLGFSEVMKLIKEEEKKNGKK